MILPFIGGPGALRDDVARAGLCFHIDLADVFADDTKADQLHAAHKADDADGGGPAGHHAAHGRLHDGPDHADEADEADHDACPSDEPDGLVGKAGDAIKCQRQHFAQGIVALTGQPLVPLVEHLLALKAHQRHHAAQEDVDLLVVGKAVQHPGADEPVVGVVEHDIRAKGIHQVVEALGGEPLEEGVGVPAAAHAVDHLGTVQIFLHHLVHGVDVILTITVDGDGDVAVVGAGLHQARQHGVLMAPVPALGNADEMRILLCKAADELPGLIAGTIVDEQHPALVADHAFFGEAGDLLQEHRRCNGQHLLLVVAGDHDPENWFRHSYRSLSFYRIICRRASGSSSLKLER